MCAVSLLALEFRSLRYFCCFDLSLVLPQIVNTPASSILCLIKPGRKQYSIILRSDLDTKIITFDI